MAIAYPLELPAGGKGIKSVKLHAMNLNAQTESPFTLQTQVVGRQGARWEMDIQLRQMKRDEAEPWLAWLISLRGRFGTFLAGDRDGVTPRGPAGGAPRCDGVATPGARTLQTKGWAPGIANILLAGDYLEVAQRLYKSLTNASSDATGRATLDVFPPIREAHPNNALLVLEEPRGTFRLSTDDASWDSSDENVYRIAFSAVEAI